MPPTSNHQHLSLQPHLRFSLNVSMAFFLFFICSLLIILCLSALVLSISIPLHPLLQCLFPTNVYYGPSFHRLRLDTPFFSVDFLRDLRPPRPPLLSPSSRSFQSPAHSPYFPNSSSSRSPTSSRSSTRTTSSHSHSPPSPPPSSHSSHTSILYPPVRAPSAISRSAHPSVVST